MKDVMVIAFWDDLPVNHAMAKFYGLFAKKAGISEANFFPVLDPSMANQSRLMEFMDVCNGLFSDTTQLFYLPLSIFDVSKIGAKEYEKNFIDKFRNHYRDSAIQILTGDEFVKRFKKKPKKKSKK